MKYRMFILTLIGSMFLTGCMSWFFGDSDEESSQPSEEVTSDSSETVKSGPNDHLELKLAKLWTKVSELEDRSNRQRERLGVLEKGLMLGVLPEELKNGADKVSDGITGSEIARPMVPQVAKEEPMLAKVLPAVPISGVEDRTSNAPAANDDDRDALLSQARNFYESGQYGRAIAVYSKLDKSGDQSHRYWVALCWFHLKEYETSFKEFSSFINNNTKNPWIPRAKYHLARVEYQLGYRARAIKQMKSVIQEFPEEDAADMARASVSRWEKAL